MFVATLLTNPDTPILDSAMIDVPRRAWNGGATRWLAPGVAAEFLLPGMPDAIEEIWQVLQAQGVDLALQPARNRRKRILIADMDSTMIGQECIDELADEAGVGPEVARITARAMNGGIAFAPALRKRVALLKGLPESTVAHVLRTPHHPDERRTGTGRHHACRRRPYGARLRRVHGFRSTHRRRARFFTKSVPTA